LTRILGISGSLRRDSYNTRLLHAAARSIAAQDAELVIFDALKAVPPYDQDDDLPDAPPLAASRLREAVAGADGLLFATPEYNSSVPGQLKNALDWASRPRASTVLANKPAAVIGAGTGRFGAVWAQAELRKVLSSAGARVVERELPVPFAGTAFDESGQLSDPGLRERLTDLAATLLSEARHARVAA
jgi:chromate reductase